MTTGDIMTAKLGTAYLHPLYTCFTVHTCQNTGKQQGLDIGKVMKRQMWGNSRDQIGNVKNRQTWGNSRDQILGKLGWDRTRITYIKQASRDVPMETYLEINRVAGD